MAILKAEKKSQNVTVLQNLVSDAYKTSDPEKMQGFAIKALKNSKKQKGLYQQAITCQNLGSSEKVVPSPKKS